jgi:hypothetical protein
MVEHEVVQDDDAGPRRSASTIQPCASASLPTWYRRDVGLRVAPEPARPREDDVDPLLQLRQEQRRVVGDPEREGGMGE